MNGNVSFDQFVLVAVIFACIVLAALPYFLIFKKRRDRNGQQ